MTLIDSYVSDGLKPPEIQQFPWFSRSVRVGFTKAAWMCHGGQMVLNHLWIKRTRLAAVLICVFFFQFLLGPLTSRFFLRLGDFNSCLMFGCGLDALVIHLCTTSLLIENFVNYHCFLFMFACIYIWYETTRSRKQFTYITIDFNALFTQATSGILPMNKWISTGFSATRIRTVWKKNRGFHLTHRWLLPMNVSDLSHICWLNPFFDWSSPHSKKIYV